MSPSKPVSSSRTIISLQMLPSDANPMGNVHGGTILKLVDVAAAVAGKRPTRKKGVSASIKKMDFYHPVDVWKLLILKTPGHFFRRNPVESGVRKGTEG